MIRRGDFVTAASRRACEPVVWAAPEIRKNIAKSIDNVVNDAVITAKAHSATWDSNERLVSRLIGTSTLLD